MHKLTAALLVGGFAATTLFTTTACATAPPDKVRMGKALVFHQDGRHERAIKEYKEVLTFHENSPEIYFNLGQIMERRGNADEAMRYYEAALENYDPDEQKQKRAQAYMALGALHFTQRNFEQARGQFTYARDEDPSDPRAHFNLGVAYQALIEQEGPQNKESAIDQYQRALEMDPQFADAHLNLAFLLELRGEIEDAQFHHSQARQHGRDDQTLVLRLDWWSDWLEQEITARRGTGAEREEGKVLVQYPRAWTLGSAARAGTTIVRTHLNTAAIIIGERAAVQVIGPEPLTIHDIDADIVPSRFAKGPLLDWMQRSMSDAYNAYMEWVEAENEETPAEEEEAAGDALRDRGSFSQFSEAELSFDDGSSGYRIRMSYQSTDASERLLTFYYYLGEAHSYVIVTTQEERGDEVTRTGHTLEYVVRGFREETRLQR